MSSLAVWLNGNLSELYPKAERRRRGREEKVKSDMHIVVDTYLVMQMHIAIFGVGLAFLFFFPDDGDC